MSLRPSRIASCTFPVANLMFRLATSPSVRHVSPRAKTPSLSRTLVSQQPRPEHDLEKDHAPPDLLRHLPSTNEARFRCAVRRRIGDSRPDSYRPDKPAGAVRWLPELLSPHSDSPLGAQWFGRPRPHPLNRSSMRLRTARSPSTSCLQCRCPKASVAHSYLDIQ